MAALMVEHLKVLLVEHLKVMAALTVEPAYASLSVEPAYASFQTIFHEALDACLWKTTAT